ncbi:MULTISPECIES: calcium-translocating P-type ATPase, PMCA-type [unclassified Breznakia]|uniref:calcium-translocating P-type ATPase, PMCA-type n=1 Tax=unclassified Breznakia TaxID=2623764 RepID=UPI0024749557|nr:MULTISPECIES: calcium-translocating P-type ATPase, PMCA-type [unclassified Breznakia]MDH6366925.1 Ca2+-transporting ATPase [Breznakia sp. PH1-1]MDH6404103.1 Ca2+-transporting ATPase [Breznakia sp. PF1-11]MDH6411812.1 Ca2+-transporting ATPase [Breznakia sp. PFB1-11]MDH6414091.1 Ca2+-transporting ATPase [Breznakia sp. PFB1-14]MDH6416552.1 Ca2+-transporting ATPase [Breznakia sp. PFB1-4]
MSAYTKKAKDVLQDLQSDPSNGLSTQEVEKRLSAYGYNKLHESKKKTLVQRFIEQFKDVMIIILLIAAAISFVVAFEEKSASAFFEPLLILFIVVLNAIVGVYQENKAEKSLEALQKMTTPQSRVIRDGKEQIIQTSDLVPGDIVKLEAGDFIPADCRLVEANALKSDESILTGESVPVDKKADAIIAENEPLGDRVNMVYSGCVLTNGTAIAVVTETGMQTEMGKIAGLLDGNDDQKTPLQERLAKLGTYLGIVALIICAIIFVMGIMDGMPILEIFMTAVSLAVSAIPEGLPVIVTVVLSIGVGRMAQRHAVVKRLPAVETLGSTSIICSDKTGTLTQNKMTLLKAYVDGGEIEDISDHNDAKVKDLLTYAILCSDASIYVDANQNEVSVGDPTETSIIAAGRKNQILQENLATEYPRLAELPFDSDRKMMSTINEIDGKHVVIVKGAYDEMNLHMIHGDLGKAAEVVESMSKEALRVIAVAYKVIDTIPDELTSESLENELTFMGVVGMIDPPREEVKESVATCIKAGIKPIMITGDHVLTATVIAKQLGIFHDGDLAISGQELAKMDDAELSEKLEKISVYARVSPEDKIRIVKAWQAKDKVVSMTGDGVNDAPSLKAADIGCAMGITGTDVAKSAADLILMDDNFATIVDAVREGRGIYNNIRRVVGYLLGTNIGEIAVVFFAMLLWRKTPLLSMQLLWINLVTDSLPAIALGMEPIHKGVMHEKPRPKKEGIFANGLGVQVVLQGIMFGLLSLIAFKIGMDDGGLKDGRTMAFIVLGLSQVHHSFSMRSHKSLFKIGPFTNKSLNKAAAVSIALMLIVIFIQPITTIFGLDHLSIHLYAMAWILSITPVIVLEIAKALGLAK